MNENKKDLFIQDFLKTQSQEGGGGGRSGLHPRQILMS